MVHEATLEKTDAGTVPVSDGWFTLHVSEARWLRSARFGKGVRFEGERRFPELGINLRVLEPGQPACMYHRENAQENFLVLSGECIFLVEGQERRLRAGHFVHCPPETHHVFVGAGDGPCVLLMVGHRPEREELFYPVSEVAGKYGASVTRETARIEEAYEGIEVGPSPPVWPLGGIG